MHKDLTWSVSQDRQVMAIAICNIDGENCEVLQQVILEADAIDSVIRKLGEAREQMVPPIQRKIDVPAKFADVHRETVFHVQRENDTSSDMILAARHNGLGWLAFGLQNHFAHMLGTMLKTKASEAQKIIKPAKPKLIT